MNAEFKFKSLDEFMAHFHNEDVCREHFAAIRFAKGEYCPHCKHNEIYKFSGGKRYRCAKCKQDFTIKTATVFGESKIPLQKWFIAIYLLTSCKKGISSVELSEKVGVTQKTGWFIDHRIREALRQNGGQLFGTIEADESYIGGKSRNMHANKRKAAGIGTGGLGKAIIAGAVSRQGEIRARVVQAVDSTNLHPFVKENVRAGSTLYTDEHRAYAGLGNDYVRKIVRHGLKEYVVGDCHTNSIESFWALFKRKYHGVHHWMSRKHLQRYLDEAVFRFNHSQDTMQRIFSDAVAQVAESRQMTYNELIQKPA